MSAATHAKKERAMPWERIAPGLFVGQFYSKRKTSKLRDHWCVIRNTGGKRQVKAFGPGEPGRERALAVATHAGAVLAARPGKPPSCGAVLESWLIGKRYGRKMASLPSVEGWVRLHLLPHFGKTLVTELTKAALWDYVVQKIEGEGRSPALVKNSLSQLRAAMNALYHREMDAFREWRRPDDWANPARRISQTISAALDEYDDRAGERQAFSPDELRVILEEAQKIEGPLYAIVRLAIATGMRRGEIVGLEWDRIDLAGGFLRLRKSAVKTRRSRVVFLSPETVDLLTRLREGAQEGQERVFPGISGDWVEKRWRKLRDASAERGVRPGVFHELRHTHVTLMQAAGVPAAILRGHTGQSSAIVDHYTHLAAANRPDLSHLDAVTGAGHQAVTGNPAVLEEEKTH